VIAELCISNKTCLLIYFLGLPSCFLLCIVPGAKDFFQSGGPMFVTMLRLLARCNSMQEREWLLLPFLCHDFGKARHGTIACCEETLVIEVSFTYRV
jgi:hypothetical protein